MRLLNKSRFGPTDEPGKIKIFHFSSRFSDFAEISDFSRFQIFQDSMRRIQGDNPVPWLSIDKSKLNGTFNNLPERDEIPELFNEQLVVELYSK